MAVAFRLKKLTEKAPEEDHRKEDVKSFFSVPRRCFSLEHNGERKSMRELDNSSLPG